MAIPKRALGNWRASIAGGWKFPVYDSLLGGWKAGLLALSPRWYAHNTIGNTAQYVVQSGLDIRSIHQALRQTHFDLKGAIPPGVAEGSFSGEAGAAVRGAKASLATGPLGPLKRVISFGFRVNSRMENVMREASYLHAAKKVLRQEGDLGTLAGSKRAAEALRNVAERAAKGDPRANAVIKHALDDMNFFLGDYRKFSTLERQVLKRAFPFYSWLRVIGRLTFGLPFRNPLRTQAMTLLSQMGAKAENPMDWMLPIWQRGGFNIGGYKFSTTSSNPWATYQDTAAAVGSGRGIGDSIGEGAQSMLSSTTPIFQAPAAYATGVQPFGVRGFSAPPGYGGSVAAYGQSPQRYNAATGRMESYTPKPNPGDFLLQQLPIVPQIRQLAADVAGGGKPYDVATSWDLIKLAAGGGGDKASLIQKPNPRYPAAVSTVPFLTSLSGFAGMPAYRYSAANAAAAYQQQLRRAFLAKRATETAQARRRRVR